VSPLVGSQIRLHPAPVQSAGPTPANPLVPDLLRHKVLTANANPPSWEPPMNWPSISPQARFDAAPSVSTTNISSSIRPEHCRIVHRPAATPPAPARHAIPEWGKIHQAETQQRLLLIRQGF